MWLLIGGDSEIGTATHQFLKGRGIASVATTRRKGHVAADRPFLDLEARLENWEPPRGTSAACIFAAVAHVAQCATNPHGSAHVNVTQTIAIADRLIAHGISVLYLSTNQVFDGTLANVVADATYCPITEYGRQKARTEAALRARIEEGAPAAILRLAKVVSPRMPLLTSWIDRLAARRPIKAFRDMTMAPVKIDMVANAIATLMENAARGIFQLTGPRDLSYLEIGRHIAQKLGAHSGLVIEGSAIHAGLPAGSARLHTTLDSSRLNKYGIVAPDVLEIINSVVVAAQSEQMAEIKKHSS